MEPDKFKKNIIDLLQQGYEVEFLGSSFDVICQEITESCALKIFCWVQRVLNRELKPIVSGGKKKYKQWQVGNLLTFRYPFRIGTIEYRILLVKVKNSIYIEFHLGNHKYYDSIRKELLD